MSEFSEDAKTQLPSLWRVKAKSYFWTLFFGGIFFGTFYAIRNSITVSNPLNGLMQPAEWTMTLVFGATTFFTLLFNKAYYWLNPDVYQNNTQTLRLINKKIDNLHSTIPKLENQLTEIYDFLITYPETTLTVKEKS